MNKNITEFIGTFFLVITILLTAVHGTDLAPIAIGSVLMVMVYMGGPISGAHYNPAVTLAALMRRKVDMGTALQYWIFQIAGAFCAALIIYLTYKDGIPAPAPAEGYLYHLKPLMMEMIFTFALVIVILNVAMSKKSAGNPYFGMAIGSTVLAGAFAVGPLSGGAFNPAVALGPMLMDAFTGGTAISNLWIYLVGPFTGAIVAVIAYGWMNPDEE